MSSFHDHGSAHYSGADVTTCDNSNLNPFMLALEKGQKAVAEFILGRDTDCLVTVGKTIEWALEKDLTLFFEVWKLFYTQLDRFRIVFTGIYDCSYCFIYRCSARYTRISLPLHSVMLAML